MGVDGVLVSLDGCNERNDRVFCAGQEIAGVATVAVSGAEAVAPESITVTFVGQCEVHWRQRRNKGTGKNRKRVTEHFRSREKYFDYVETVFPRVEGDSLTPGSHSFPFRFKLPEDVPSSLQRNYGQIFYYARATVALPWAFDKSHKLPFTVVSLVDLNRMPNIAEPVSQEDTKKLYTMVLKRGEVTAKVTLNKSGFVPGEDVMISAEVKNDSKVVIEELRAEARQQFTFVGCHGARRRQKQAKKTLGRIFTQDNLDHAATWAEQPLRIPSVPPWDNKFCENIKIDYILEFHVVPKGLHTKMTFKFPLVIGTVPFKEQFQALNAVTHQASPPAPTTRFFGRLYPDLPPPSYAEATEGTIKAESDDDSSSSPSDDDDDDKSNKSEDGEFKPKYPLWAFN